MLVAFIVLVVVIIVPNARAEHSHFWQITDVHLNYAYPAHCQCNGFEDGCNKFGDFFCGSSLELYQSAVARMASTYGADVGFVAHTGDVSDSWNTPNTNVLYETNAFSASTLMAAFPRTPVFFAFGNHDFPAAVVPGPLDCPYQDCAPHYRIMCSAWARDLDAAALASCSSTGYYFVDGKVAGVRVVVINTEFFNWEGGVRLDNATRAAAADEHLDWLAEVIRTAPAKVMVLGHIPPFASIPFSEEGFVSGKLEDGYVSAGVQTWWGTHIETYNGITADPKVTLQVFGHVHVDSFAIAHGGATQGKRPGDGRAPSKVLWSALGLVASYPPRNGGIRRYTFDNETKQTTDVLQLHYDVAASNRSGQLSWKKSWRASQDLVPNANGGAITPEAVRDVVWNWRRNSSAHSEFRSRAFGRVRSSVPPACADERCRMLDVCGAASAEVSEYALCLRNWDCQQDHMAREERCELRTAKATPW